MASRENRYLSYGVPVTNISSGHASNTIKEDSQMSRLLQLHNTLRGQFQSAPKDDRHEGEVHFHQGPQGQATPCFEGDCPNPRLAV
jgi:hypothetical protein